MPKIEYTLDGKPTRAYDLLNERVPRTLRDGIELRTATEDMGPYIQEAITEYGDLLYLSPGTWPIGAGTTTPLIVAGMSNVRIYGGSMGHKLAGYTVLKALADTTDITQSAAMLWIGHSGATATGYTHVDGIVFDRNNTKGNGVYFCDSDHSSIKNCTFQGMGGITSGLFTGNSGTNFVSRASSQGAWRGAFANGDRVEAFVSSITGSALPSGLAIDTPYYVVNAVGNAFQLSATLGGSAVALGTNGSGTWGFYKGCYTVDSLNAGSNLVNIANHGFSNGMRLRACCPAHLFDGQYATAIPSWCGNHGYDNWTTNVSTGSFGLVGRTVSGAVGATKWKLGAIYHGLIMGGLLYCEVSHNVFTNAHGGLSCNLYNSSRATRPYGANDTIVAWNKFYSGGNDYGGNALWYLRNGHEGRTLLPNESLILANDGVFTTPTMSGGYMEPVAGNTNFVGIIQNNALVKITGGFEIRGNGVSETGSQGFCQVTTSAIRIDPSVSMAGVAGQVASFASWSNRAANVDGRSPDVFDGVYQLSPSETSADGFFAHVVRSGTARHAYRQFSKYVGWQWGMAHYIDTRVTATNPTSLELSLGNAFQINGNSSHSITSLKVNGVETSGTVGHGWKGTLYTDSVYTTLAASKFVTLSGADYKMASGETLDVVVDALGKGRLVQPMGSVVARTPAALASYSANVAAQNLLSAAPSPGQYTVKITLSTVTVATAGTLAIAVAWNDGTGKTLNVINAFDVTVTGTGYAYAVLPVSVASGNISVAATFTGLTGTPVITMTITASRDT